jgi:hypothetical protein
MTTPIEEVNNTGEENSVFIPIKLIRPTIANTLGIIINAIDTMRIEKKRADGTLTKADIKPKIIVPLDPFVDLKRKFVIFYSSIRRMKTKIQD